MASGFATNYLNKLLKNPLFNKALHLGFVKANLSSSFIKEDHAIKKNSSTPHPVKDPPDNYNPSCVEHEALEVPDFIPPAVFRPFTSPCEILGPGADKRDCYKNSEYFAYHRYSFVALQVVSLKLREQRMKETEIRCLYDYDDSDDEIYSSLEDNID